MTVDLFESIAPQIEDSPQVRGNGGAGKRCQFCREEAAGLYFIDQEKTKRARLCEACADKRTYKGISARRYLAKSERAPLVQYTLEGKPE